MPLPRDEASGTEGGVCGARVVSEKVAGALAPDPEMGMGTAPSAAKDRESSEFIASDCCGREVSKLGERGEERRETYGERRTTGGIHE